METYTLLGKGNVDLHLDKKKEFMPGLAALARTVSKCIKSKQINILLSLIDSGDCAVCWIEWEGIEEELLSI